MLTRQFKNRCFWFTCIVLIVVIFLLCNQKENKNESLKRIYNNNISLAFKAGYTVATYDALRDSLFYIKYDSLRNMRIKEFNER